MFFTPFAFIQSAAAAIIPGISLQGYYLGGAFTSYADTSSPYFRVLDSTGSISSSFNIGTGVNSGVYAVVTQSDGKIIIGGDFTTYSGSSATRITRLNTNGTRDTTFNPGTVGGGNIFYSLAVQSDGKIVGGGIFNAYSGSTKNNIIRINTNGTADTGSTWNQGTGFGSQVNAVAIQSDGKIIAVGAFTTYSGSTRNYIARLNTDGTADTGSTWNQGTGLSLTANTVSIQSDQKIIVGGGFGSYSGSAVNRIVRLNTNGTLDTTFNIGTGFNNSVFSTAIQSDGKILAAGSMTTYSGSGIGYITRLNTNGTIDTSFNPGTGFDNTVSSVTLQNDGKILVQGNFSFYSGSRALSVVRINSDGTRDTTFNTALSINGATAVGSSLLALSNGLVILGGVYTGPKIGYMAFLDTSGNPTVRNIVTSNGFNSSVTAIVPLTGSRILAGGLFTVYSGSTKNYMVNLLEDGTVITGSTWNTGVGFNSTAQCFATQSDGKILVGGSFTTYSGSNATRIVRLNTNGTVDTTFNPGTTGINGTVSAIGVQADGKIIPVGNYTTYSGSTKNYITRANTDGTSDTGSTWNIGVGFNGNTITLGIQSDQKIVVGGSFTSYSGSTKNYIVRLNTDGTADTGSTWNQGTGFGNAVQKIAIQPDQKIVAVGLFTTYSGSSVNRIVRINSDGTRDTTFNIGTGFPGTPTEVRVQDDGKIMVGGNFTSYSGSTVNRIVRINPDGTRDLTFQPTASGFNASVNWILPYYA